MHRLLLVSYQAQMQKESNVRSEEQRNVIRKTGDWLNLKKFEVKN